VIYFSYLATTNIAWIWGTSFAIVLQYITDVLDGAIGRARDTGLVKWGFYMDHFFDFIFLSSIIVGYFFFVPPSMRWWTYALLIISAAYMVSSFLEFAATNSFKISFFRIGPTESRLGMIMFNIAIFFFGGTIIPRVLPVAVIIASIGLAYAVYTKHTMLWQIDMDAKQERMKR